MNRLAVSEALIAIQCSLSLTARELAKVMGVDPGTIRRWTSGDVDPSEDAARKLLTIRSVAGEWDAQSDFPLRREIRSHGPSPLVPRDPPKGG